MPAHSVLGFAAAGTVAEPTDAIVSDAAKTEATAATAVHPRVFLDLVVLRLMSLLLRIVIPLAPFVAP